MTARPGGTIPTAIVHKAVIKPQADALGIMTVTLDDIWQGTFERRKSWSLRNYADEALRQSGCKAAYDFTYTWDLS